MTQLLSTNKVDFFLVGAQKCATTWIHRCLREHPDIYLSKEDEIHYFDIHHHLGIDWYHQFFVDRKDEIFVGDTTSSYIRDFFTPERIHAYNPDSKIIFSLRNPTDRAFSHYWHEKKKGKIAFDFEELFENYDLFESWIRVGFYWYHLKRFEQFFDRNQMLVLIQEEILHDRQGTLKRIFEFIGADTGFVGKHTDILANVAPRTDTSNGANEYGQGMRPETRERLDHIFRPEILKLEQWMGRRLNAWDTTWHAQDGPKKQIKNIASSSLSDRHCGYLHRVLPTKHQFGIDKANTITVKEFDDLLRKLSTRYEMVKLSDLVKQIENDQPISDQTYALSFDDGYVDTVDHILPILEEYQVPATIFITVGFINGSIIPYEVILSRFVEHANSSLLSTIARQELSATEDICREDLYDLLRKKIKSAPYEDRMAFLHKIGAQPLITSWQHEDYFLNYDQLKTIAKHPLIDIGAHTFSHPLLTAINFDFLIKELRDSKTALQNCLDREISLLAYPYGSYNDQVLNAALATGYHAAFTTASHAKAHEKASLKLKIPRMDLCLQ